MMPGSKLPWRYFNAIDEKKWREGPVERRFREVSLKTSCPFCLDFSLEGPNRALIVYTFIHRSYFTALID
jgi:hypothetical protein